jgi:predicted GH43/DUF377 family glycosyl hydrolase
MFVRSSHNPILKPDKNISWRSLKVYNPAVLFENNRYKLFYRAVDQEQRSSIGYGQSSAGIKFTLEKQPSIKPAGKFETCGAEDPRLVKVGKEYLLTYTAYDGDYAKLALAQSFDLKKWKKFGPILPDWDLFQASGFLVDWDEARVKNNPKWCKAGGIFSEKFEENYLMLFGDSNMWFAESNNLKTWQTDTKPFIRRRPGFFDNAHLEMGPPPIKTKHGWLVLYHGVDDKIVYRLGYLLLDLKNPRKIIKRSKSPIFEPRAPYELTGLIDIAKNRKPKVIFCNGAVLIGNILKIYYGAADSVICTASAKLEDILRAR